MYSRRELLLKAAKYSSLAGSAAVTLGNGVWDSLIRNAEARDRLDELIRSAPKARFWTSAAATGKNCAPCHEPGTPPKEAPGKDHGKNIKCLLCAQGCVLQAGQRGGCRARINVNGEMRSLVYGRPVSVHVDPIEKKPFYHFLPGSAAFSLATSGCPLHCKFCQNWEISQSRPEDLPADYVAPGEIVSAARSRQAPVIAFTYNEPTVFTEYLTDIARSAKSERIRCVMISCGFMNEAPLTEICSLLDAIKIDLKGFDEGFYRNVCSAELRPVLRSIKQIAASGVHLEIVNLVVPTLNDSEKMLGELSAWIAGELGPDVPVHFTRFHPDYQLLNLPPTPVSTLEKAREIAMKRGIHYAFVGNVPGHAGNNTYCPKCGKAVIKRSAFFVEEMNLKRGQCKFCNTKIAGVWN
jgi:pyruvate formate lyase activating enzyme